jgi:hypothetical protein
LVSYQLTVNVILLGLGSVRNLQVSYPQPISAVPVNPQALNRYSYVLNNPLRYTDPTGYVNWGKVLGGVVIIIAVDLCLATPITLVAIASYAVPPVAPAITAVAAAVDIFAIAATIFSIYLINEGLSEDNDQKTPQLPASKSDPATSTGFAASLTQLDYLEHYVGESEYQAWVDYAYNDVADSLGENQMVAWSSDRGYYAADDSVDYSYEGY